MTQATMSYLELPEACGKLPGITSEVPGSLVSFPNHLISQNDRGGDGTCYRESLGSTRGQTMVRHTGKQNRKSCSGGLYREHGSKLSICLRRPGMELSSLPIGLRAAPWCLGGEDIGPGNRTRLVNNSSGGSGEEYAPHSTMPLQEISHG